MALKTIFLPANDADEARDLFQATLQTETVLFVVLGQGDGPDALVTRANRLAGDANDPRWVIAAPRLSDILATIQGLRSASPDLKPAIVGGTAVAFTISADSRICDVIEIGEEADDLRVLEAYLAAE